MAKFIPPQLIRTKIGAVPHGTTQSEADPPRNEKVSSEMRRLSLRMHGCECSEVHITPVSALSARLLKPRPGRSSLQKRMGVRGRLEERIESSGQKTASELFPVFELGRSLKEVANLDLNKDSILLLTVRRKDLFRKNSSVWPPRVF